MIWLWFMQLCTIINQKSFNMENQKILILGGNGKTGRRVAQLLKDNSTAEVYIGSRNGIPSFYWENPETWPEVIEGINTVYSPIWPFRQHRKRFRNLQLSLHKTGFRKLYCFPEEAKKKRRFAKKL